MLVTTASQDCENSDPSVPDQLAPVLGLDAVAMGAEYVVCAVAGEDALSARLASCGIWPGAVIERIASAPFGDPVLFRLHGYRLALRRAEAERVTVQAAQAEPAVRPLAANGQELSR